MGVNDFVDNLHQSEPTRGLSGGVGGSVAIDEANPYYNNRLRRHRTDGDLVEDPTLLWYTSPYVESREGLGVHIATTHHNATRTGFGTPNTASFTDVLLILSREDHERTQTGRGEPWIARALRALIASFDDYCAREGFHRKYPDRQLGFRILCDGSPELGGTELGLRPGEFVTGLLSNLYTGPVKGSRPVIALHVNVPGVWEGYQEVGRLYNDQILFTMGSSWLDNFSHPSLQESALYRLRQGDDGGFVHIISPDLQDRYQLTTSEQGDTSVVTLATRAGEPLAYIVLAIVEDMEQADPSIAPPMMLGDEVQRIDSTMSLSKTIIPEAPSERIFTLQERGALLQRVHFKNFMQGYDVYLGSRGELGTVVEDKAATFQVRRREVNLIAHIEGIELDGAPLPVGAPVTLDQDHTITALGQPLQFRYLRGLKVEKWPYVAEIRRPASSNYMMWGQNWTVGRAIDARVVLPDNPDNRNIHWKPEVDEGAYIRARTGDIEKSRFYTDSIMVASNHAEIDLAAEEPAVVCTAKHCFVYVRRDGAVFPLYPTSTGKQPTEMTILPGDELLIGNSVFYVGYQPLEAAVAPAPAPSLSTDSLVAAVSAPDFSESRPDAPAAAAKPPADSNPQFSTAALEPMDEPVLDDLADAKTVSNDLADASIPAAPAAVEWEEDDGWDDGEEDTDLVAKGRLKAESAPPPPPRSVEPPPPPPKPEPPPAPEPPPVVEAESAPEPPPAPAPQEAPAAEASGPVVCFVDEEDAQFELGREVHLVHTGWMVVGTLSCGNHTGADLILPENRIDEDQTFEPVTYFELKVRGRRSTLTVQAASEFLYDEADVSAAEYKDIDEVPIDIIRRDDQGDEDFAVRLELFEDPSLPNPRARFLMIDTADKLAAALVTKGLPLGQGRTLALDGVTVTATTDGTTLTLSDYLDTYRQADGSFAAFFVQKGEEDFKTAPEDGSPIELKNDDRVIIGHAVYLVRDR